MLEQIERENVLNLDEPPMEYESTLPYWKLYDIGYQDAMNWCKYNSFLGSWYAYYQGYTNGEYNRKTLRAHTKGN